MQLTNLDMINNAVKTAKYKLSQHRVQGENSNLTIFQVARLMDTVKKGEDLSESNSASVFYSLN